MKCKVLTIGAVVLLLAALAWAADVIGKWVAQVPGRGGNTTETTFNLTADGAKLTGTVSSPMGDSQISEGKISGDDISFAVVRSTQMGEMKFVYKGKVSGDEIKFTRQMEGGMPGGGMGGGPGGGPGGGRGPMQQEFVAKRVK